MTTRHESGQYRGAGKVTELTRQQTRFLSLMEGWSKAAEYATIASDSAGKSAEKLAIYQESVEAKTAKATAAFENLSNVIMDSRIIGAVMDAGTWIFNLLAELEGVPVIMIEITGAAALLYASLKSLSAMKFGQNFIGFFSGLG